MNRVWTIVLMLLPLLSIGQPHLEWANRIGGVGRESFNAVCVHGDQVISAGGFQGSLDIDPGPGFFNLESESFLGGPFIQSLDSLGNFYWGKVFNIASDFDQGDIYCSKWTGNLFLIMNGTTPVDGVDIDLGPATHHVEANQDAVIIKLSSIGEIIWARVIGGPGLFDVSLFHIETDSLDNVYAAWSMSETSGLLDVDPSSDTLLMDPVEGSVFIHKMDANGNLLWAKQVGGQFSTLQDMSMDIDANIYMTGHFTWSPDFDPGPDSLILSTPSSSSDVFVLKLNGNGDLQWAHNFGGWTNDSGSAIKATPSGGTVVAGWFRDTVDFDPGPDTLQIISTGLENSFIMQLSSSGDLEWIKAYNEYIGFTDIVTDGTGNIHVSGGFRDTVDFNQGSEEFLLIADTFPFGSNRFVMTLDEDGTFIWAGALGYTGYDSPTSLAFDDFGNLYCNGGFSYTSDFNPSPFEEHLLIAVEDTFPFGANKPDAFVVKLNMDSLLTSLQEENDRTGQLTMAAYPNPSTGNYNVFLSKPENVRYSVSDVRGQIIQNNTVSNTNHFNVEISGSTGIYFLEVIAGEDKRVIKLVKH